MTKHKVFFHLMRIVLTLFIVLTLMGCHQKDDLVPSPILYDAIGVGYQVIKSSDGSYDIYNQDNELIVDTAFDYFNDLSEQHLFVVGYHDQYGVLDWYFNYVIPMDYLEIDMFSNVLFNQSTNVSSYEAMFFCKDSYGWHVLDKTGALIIDTIFEDKNGELVQTIGTLVFNSGVENLDMITPVLLNTIIVEVNGKWGLLDFLGHMVIPAEYDGIENFNGPSNLIKVQVNGKWGIINDQNQVLLDINYNEIDSFNSTIQNNEGLWGIYDSDSLTVIVEPLYESLYKISDHEYYGLLNGTNVSITIE